MHRSSRRRLVLHIGVSVLAIAIAAFVTFQSVPRTPPTLSSSDSPTADDHCKADISLKKDPRGHLATVCGFQFVYPNPWIIKSFRGVQDGESILSSVFRDAKGSVRGHLRCPETVSPPGGNCTVRSRNLTSGSRSYLVDMYECSEQEKASNGHSMGQTQSVVLRIHSATSALVKPSCEIFPEVSENHFDNAVSIIKDIFASVELE